MPLLGAPATESFGAVPRDHVLEALEASLTWHRDDETRSPSSVLNACRAWRYAADQTWSSKGEAAAWVQGRFGAFPIVGAALAAREAEGLLDQAPVRAFISQARESVLEARGAADDLD